MSYQGFHSEAFTFFHQLAKNNNKAWFDANRARYDEYITGGFRALLERMTPVTLGLNSEFEVRGKTNGNFSRINRDIRFSKDKSPYKLNFYCFFYNRSLSPKYDGRLYAGLSAEGVTIGFSIYNSEKSSSRLETVLRPRALKEDELLRSYLKKRRLASKYDVYWYQMVKGEWTKQDGFPRTEEEWTKLQALIVRKLLPAADPKVTSPALAREMEKVFQELYPLYVFSAVGDRDWKAQFEEAVSG